MLLQSNQEFLNHRYGMVVGDLNSNSQWDKQHRGCCHSDVVHELSKLGLESAYHRYFGEAQGEETTPTFFLQRNRAKSFHIDYAFLGKHWSAKRCEVGSVDSWISLSDHMPLSLHLSTEDAEDFGVA
ncbi:hypothetical protein [Hydrogenophaga atypica]|uniref:Endonuclease/exonuclease/phosphatase domain-containing protein n=1 Tax=Hydrogenophaga atypica TaxID=249409 RepID=A0ABW2QK79_9BURK